ncbi:MAG: YlxR family protein [Clostridiales bacterium]|nr:YlxR family protein [Clostridiales bacterium]
MNKSKGSPRGKTARLRRCVACREMKEKAELLRVVRSPEGNFAIDESFKAPGRGAYLCKSETCLTKTLKSRGFDRSFKCKVPQEVYEGIPAFAGMT